MHHVVTRDWIPEPTGRRLLPELNHLAQGDARGRERGIMPDGIHQDVGLLPRHDERRTVNMVVRQFFPFSSSSPPMPAAARQSIPALGRFRGVVLLSWVLQTGLPHGTTRWVTTSE